MLNVHLVAEPEPLYIIRDIKMGMWVSSRGHCTQKKYAKLYTKVEADAIVLHAEKEGFKLKAEPADEKEGNY